MVKEPKFTPINVNDNMENGMSMEYKKEKFTEMSIRSSTGDGLGRKIERKILSAKEYITRGNNDGY